MRTSLARSALVSVTVALPFASFASLAGCTSPTLPVGIEAPPDSGTQSMTEAGSTAPLCSWPASLDDAAPRQCSAARAYVACNYPSGVSEDFMTNDPTTYLDASAASCTDLCHADEYAVGCGGVGPEPSPPLPSGCRSLPPNPGGGVSGCCPCEVPPAVDGSSDVSTLQREGGSDAMQVSECVDPTLGAACSAASTPCQPANPCASGYIWSCNQVWFHELITCFSTPNASTTTTSACPDGEVLFVDDAAGDLCQPASDAGTCATGFYRYPAPDHAPCCYSATQAWCVPTPAACDDGISCDCVESVCTSQCGPDGDPAGVMCAKASGSVVDCLCGKA